MFAKPAKISGNVVLGKKEVKKLHRNMTECISSTCNSSDAEIFKCLLASKAAVKKISFQAPSRIVVYVLEETKEPLIFDISGKNDFCFSVYALWRFPNLLLPLVVYASVSEYILRGADVMLPGVVFASEEHMQSLRKGELRAVYAQGNPCAIAVGEVLIDAAEMERSGKKGRALKLWHVVGDQLWNIGPQTLPNRGFEANKVSPFGDGEKDPGVTLEMVTLEEYKEVKSEQEITKQQMDSHYVGALLQALKTAKIRENDLPILVSSFHANVLLPCRRAGASLNIKRSSFKQLSVFLKAMEAHGLVEVADNDGIQTITNIDRRHPDVISHDPYHTDEQAQLEEQATIDRSAGLSNYVSGRYAPDVEERIGLSPSLKALISSSLGDVSFTGQPLQKYWSSTEIRDLVTQYVENCGLIDSENKKYVRLNGPLTDALYGNKAPVNGYPDRIARPEMLSLLVSKCSHYHRIKLFPTHAAKFHGGKLRPITIHVEKLKRRSNITVTYVAHYQQFGIDGATLAKEAQKKWGCSAALHISEDKSKGEEIEIHGHMANEVMEYLVTKYLINAKYCTITYGKNLKAKKKK